MRKFYLIILLLIAATSFAQFDPTYGQRLAPNDAYVGGTLRAATATAYVGSATIYDTDGNFAQDDLEFILDDLYDSITTVGSVRLDQITSPNASSSINMNNNTWQVNFTNPDGGWLFNMSGAGTNDLIEINQNTGNPAVGSTLLEIEAEDPDVNLLHLIYDGDSSGEDMIDFQLDRATPTNGDYFYWRYLFDNSVGSATEFVHFDFVASDVTAGNETGAFRIDIINEGVLTNRLNVNGVGIGINEIDPQAALHVTDSTPPIALFESTQSEVFAEFLTGTNTTKAVQVGSFNDNFLLRVADEDRILIDDSTGFFYSYADFLTDYRQSTATPGIANYVVQQDVMYNSAFEAIPYLSVQTTSVGITDGNEESLVNFINYDTGSFNDFMIVSGHDVEIPNGNLSVANRLNIEHATSPSTFYLEQDSSFARIVSQRDLYLDPTNNGTASGKIKAATVILFDDYVGRKLQFFSHSYTIGLSDFDLDYTSDRNHKFHSDTVEDLLIVEGDAGNVRSLNNIISGNQLLAGTTVGFTTDSVGTKVSLYGGDLYSIGVAAGEVEFKSDTRFTFSSDLTTDALILDADTGQLTGDGINQTTIVDGGTDLPTQNAVYDFLFGTNVNSLPTSIGSGQVAFSDGSTLVGDPGLSYNGTDNLILLESQNADTLYTVDNPANGTVARAGFRAINDLDGSFNLLSVNSGYTGVSDWNNSGVVFTNSGLSDGLKINAFSDGITFETGGYGSAYSRMRIDSSGNVGINETSPQAKLHIVGANGDDEGTPTLGISTIPMVIQNNSVSSNAAYLQFISGTAGISGLLFGDKDDITRAGIKADMVDDSLALSTGNDVTAIDIDSSQNVNIPNGNLGINETSQDRHLHVNSGGIDIAAKFESTDPYGGIELYDNTTANPPRLYANGDDFELWQGSTQRFVIDDSAHDFRYYGSDPDIEYYNYDAFSAGNSIQQQFNMKNSLGSYLAYYREYVTSTGTTSGSETGTVDLQTYDNGTFASFLQAVGHDVSIPNGDLLVGNTSKTETYSVLEANTSNNTAMNVSAVNTGTGQIGYVLNRTGGTAARWYLYIPSGSGDYVFYNGSERLRLSSTGVLTGDGIENTTIDNGGLKLTTENAVYDFLFGTNVNSLPTSIGSGQVAFSDGSTLVGDSLFNYSTTTGMLAVNNGFAGRQGTVTTIRNPEGGSLETSGSVTGAIQVELPNPGTATMLKIWIDVFDYTANESFTVIAGGYSYTTTNDWINTFAQIISNKTSNRNLTIRFGEDGTSGNHCIWVGETNSTWEYLGVTVSKVQAHFNSDAIGTWDDGWSIQLDTDFTGDDINVLHRNTLVSPWIADNDTVGDIYYAYDGNVGIGTTSPGSQLSLYRNDTDEGQSILIEQDSTGNASLGFSLTGTKQWTMGVDNSDLDSFKIGDVSNFSSQVALTLTTGENVGINETSPDRTLHVNSGAVDIVAKFESTDSFGGIELADPTTTGGTYLATIGDDFYLRTNNTNRFVIDDSLDYFEFYGSDPSTITYNSDSFSAGNFVTFDHYLKDSLGNNTLFGRFITISTDPTDGSETSTIDIRGRDNGAFDDIIQMLGHDVNIPNGLLTVSNNLHVDAPGYLSFYSSLQELHSITSDDSTGTTSDDLRVNTFGSLYINLDSNNNQTSDASFRIGRHGQTTTLSDWLFTVDGETGYITGDGIRSTGSITNGGLLIPDENTVYDFVTGQGYVTSANDDVSETELAALFGGMGSGFMKFNDTFDTFETDSTSYLPVGGGTISGNLTVEGNLAGGTVYSDNSVQADLQVVAGTGFVDGINAGVDGTFVDNNGNTITVSGGIITDLGV